MIWAGHVRRNTPGVVQVIDSQYDDTEWRSLRLAEKVRRHTWAHAAHDN